MIYEEVQQFLKTRPTRLCVLATSSQEGQPQAALLLYSVTNDFTIIFSTQTTSRKWKNLELNQKVALTVGFGFEEKNVQIEGTATCITHGDDFKQCEELYFTDHPEVAHFKGMPGIAYIKVKPHWIRLNDYAQHPNRTEEQMIA